MHVATYDSDLSCSHCQAQESLGVDLPQVLVCCVTSGGVLPLSGPEMAVYRSILMKLGDQQCPVDITQDHYANLKFSSSCIKKKTGEGNFNIFI